MGVIKLNPDNLKKKIRGLRDKADEAGRARASIDRESENLGDPSPSMAVETFRSDSATHIDNVRACADHIETEMNRIIELNENGIATKSSGVITVENVPDAVLLGGAGEFNTWSQGALDAKDLQTITQGKKPKSNRTYDDVATSIQANLVSESYSTGFIETVGVENLTQLPLDVATSFTRKKKNGANDSYYNTRPEADDQIATLLGQLLANASRTWDDKKSQDAADKITSSVNQKGHSGRITCLNKIIGFNENGSGPLSNSNGNPDFGTPFLVRLGNNLEKLDQKAIDDAVEFEKNKIRNNADAKATLIHNGSSNTLGGLIEAMTDNPEAAAQWLAPNGLDSSEQDIKRIRKITSHRALADTAWTDSVLEMTKEISTLGDIDTSTASEAQIKRAGQAALAVSGIVNQVGESDANLSSAARLDMDKILATYAPGVDVSMQTGGDSPGTTTSTYTMNSDKFTAGYWGSIPPQALFSDYTLSSLMGQLSENPHGLDNVTAELALINDRRMNAAAVDFNNTGNTTQLKNAMTAYQNTQGYVTGAITQHALDKGAQADARANAWIDGLMSLSTFMPGASGAGHVIDSAFTYAQARSEEGLKSTLHNTMEHHTANAAASGAEITAEKSDNANRAMMLQLIKNGAITPQQLQAWDGKDAASTIIKEDGSLDYSKLSSTDKKTQEEVDNAFKHMAGNFPDSADHNVANAYGDSQEGFKEGNKRSTIQTTTTKDNKQQKVDPNKFGDN